MSARIPSATPAVKRTPDSRRIIPRVDTFGDRRPELSYPCIWTYRVICTDEEALRTAVVALMGTSEHTLVAIGASASGRYQRLELRVHVRDEIERNDIFQALGRIEVVRFVL